jgi:PAS domain S-box-containing protein
LLFLTTKDGKLIPTLGSQLAFEYLKAEGIQLKSIDASKGQFQLGRAVFRTLEPNDGGYVSVDAGGYQILSNFPNFPRGFCTISMTEMLQGHIPKSLMRASGEAPLRDRIVLIGVTAESVEDRFFTSTTTDSVAAPAGVEVHALLTSQLLSAALDGRPFLNVWSDPVEWLWVILWGTIGAVIGWRSPSPQQMVVKTLLLTIVLLGSAYVLFLMGWWVIIIPPLFALMGSAITSNGYRLWENLKGYTRRLEQRVQERTLILQQEIAERKRVESSLAESEARFRLLAEATIEGIAIIEQGKILDVNEAFIQMFGYSASAITKMPPSDIVTPDYRELVVHNIQSHYDGFYEVVCLRSDGTTFPAEFHAKVMSDGDRVIRITSIRDISDRKRAEAAAVLEERNRMAREIHDTLAQAFTGILLQVGGAIKLITKNPDLVQSHLQTAKELARTGLTEARRSVAALRPKVLEEGDLPSALKQLITQMQSSTDAHFTCEISGEAKVLSPYIEDNLFRIGQEALTNAIKYADASEIEVELVYEETQFLFRVKDNGRGFDIDQISPGINGFGLLGMSERVERIGGELIIQSHPGEGTEVVVIVNRE